MAANTPSANPAVPLATFQQTQSANAQASKAPVNQAASKVDTSDLPGSMARPPVIGSYRDPKSKVEDKRGAEVSPAKTLVEGITSEMERDAEDNKEGIERAKTYEEILLENDISRSKATAIIDDLLTKGFYEEDMPLTSTVYVTLRTRSQADYRRYLRALEVSNPKYLDEQREVQMRYFIAASLVNFKGQTFEHPEVKMGNDRAVDAAFDERLSWITRQPEAVITLIAVKLSKFDRMVQVVMSEGVIENF